MDLVLKALDIVSCGNDDTPRQILDSFETMCATKSPQECATGLRAFNYDVSESLAASMNEDGYTVTKTLTRKGLRVFLAEREYLGSLLSDD